IMGIAPNDSGWMGYCVCENCKAWDSPNAPDAEQPLVYANELTIRTRAITDRKVRFWNEAARRVRAHFPDRNIQLLSYGYNAYRTPPVDIKLEDNIIIQFEGMLLRHRPMNNDKLMADHRVLWQGWAQQATQIVWRPNLRLGRPADPYNLLRRYGETVNFLAEN